MCVLKEKTTEVLPTNAVVEGDDANPSYPFTAFKTS